MEKNTSMAEWTKKKYEEREIRWKRREYAGKIVAELRMRAQLFEWRGVETEVAKERGIRLQGGGVPATRCLSVCLMADVTSRSLRSAAGILCLSEVSGEASGRRRHKGVFG